MYRYATVTVNHHTVQVIGDHAPELAERFRRLEQARADRQQRRARLEQTTASFGENQNLRTLGNGYRKLADSYPDNADDKYPEAVPRWMRRINAWYFCLGLTGFVWLLAWLFVVFVIPFFSGMLSAWRAASGH